MVIRYGLVYVLLPLVVVSLPTSPLFITNAAKVHLKCDEGKQYDEYSESCCQLCPQGYGVGLPCVQSNDTVCEPCVDGKSYSATQSHDEFCQVCSMCPANSEVEYKCNVTHNTKCRCVSGYYFNGVCKSCDRCSPGEKAEPACSPYHNTICKPCPAGHYSNDYGTSTSCRPCSKCPRGQSAKVDCTPSQDTVCETETSPEDGDKMAYDTGFNLNTLFCIPLAAICVGLIAYVVNKRWKFCNSAPSKSSNLSNKAGSNISAKSKQIEQSNHNVKRQETKPLMLSNSGDNVLVNNLHKGVLPALGEMLMKDCDVDKCGWKALARCSDFQESQIKSIEIEAANCKTPAATIYLQQWSQMYRFATVGILYANLNKIRRPDCISMINSSINKYRNDNNYPMI